VKVTLSGSVPWLGVVDGVVQANVPFTEAAPPAVAVLGVSVEDASVCPVVIALAVGHVVTVGVALLTVTRPAVYEIA